MKKNEKKSWIIIDILLGVVLICLLLSLNSCVATKYVPVQGEHRIEYRDSLIYLKDTVYVRMPQEQTENKTMEDSSHLETSIAKSDAWIDDKGTLNHTLENKETPVEVIVDTVVVTQTKTEYLEKPVIETVEIPKPYIPTLFWIAMCYMVLSLGLKIYRMFSKLL